MRTGTVMYQADFERITAFLAGHPVGAELSSARKQYFSMTGNVQDNEPSFENRVQAFLEWFVLERLLEGDGRLPLDVFLTSAAGEASEVLQRAAAFRHSVTGVFELTRMPNRRHLLRARNLLDGFEYEVVERRQIPALKRGEIFESRLLLYNGDYVLSTGTFYHPKGVKKYLTELFKGCDPSNPAERRRLLNVAATMHARFQRYAGRFDINRIYTENWLGRPSGENRAV
ncbi:MAG: hypothetical protein GMKNLPBB_02622 [Myxococcota bacterium]|nr:hypothetical protein [Myxococcota bacterium]